MEQIESLIDRITDELQDAIDYAKCASEYKSEYPDVAETLYTISTQEYRHADLLQDAVKRISERNQEEPAMGAFLRYMSGKHIDMMADARTYQDIYKEKK